MLALTSRFLRPALLRTLSCCAAEAAAVDGAVAAQPGTVNEYHQHLLLQFPRSDGSSAPSDESSSTGSGTTGGGMWWPKFVEKEPAIVAAFSAVARHQDVIAGKVKITAFEDVPSSSSGGGNSSRRSSGSSGNSSGSSSSGSGSSNSSQSSGGSSSSGGDRGPEPGTVNMMAFPAGLRFDGLAVDRIGLAVVFAASIDPNRAPLSAAELKAVLDRMTPAADLSLFVCCHASRDARCGTAGPPLAAALQRLVRERGVEQHVQVFQTSHVGGHKFAANVVAYGAMHPCDGDWFGGLHAGNAEAFLDALLGVELGVDGGAGDPALRPFWRGRMGLSRVEQTDLFESGGAIEELGEMYSDSSEAEEQEEEDWGEEDFDHGDYALREGERQAAAEEEEALRRQQQQQHGRDE